MTNHSVAMNKFSSMAGRNQWSHFVALASAYAAAAVGLIRFALANGQDEFELTPNGFRLFIQDMEKRHRLLVELSERHASAVLASEHVHSDFTLWAQRYSEMASEHRLALDMQLDYYVTKLMADQSSWDDIVTQ
jgi:hypothetical protein